MGYGSHITVGVDTLAERLPCCWAVYFVDNNDVFTLLFTPNTRDNDKLGYGKSFNESEGEEERDEGNIVWLGWTVSTQLPVFVQVECTL